MPASSFYVATTQTGTGTDVVGKTMLTDTQRDGFIVVPNVTIIEEHPDTATEGQIWPHGQVWFPDDT
jgi:hypothetical protein